MAVNLGEKGYQTLLDLLAFLEHEQWSHWIKYMDSKAIHGQTTVKFTNGIWYDWIVKSNYDYNHLCPNDRVSDQDWAKKVLQILEDNAIISKNKTVKK